MQVKYWTNFNKRKNSTKRPSGGTEISVSLKNPCSVENPQIEVVGEEASGPRSMRAAFDKGPPVK